MPHTTSAKKALRQSTKLRLHHRSQRSALRTLLKTFDKAVADPEVSADEKSQLFSRVTKSLDQSAAKNLIHKNAASRTKSRLQKRLTAATQNS